MNSPRERKLHGPVVYGDIHKRRAAVEFLSHTIPDDEKETLRSRIAEDPKAWWSRNGWHFVGGMRVRNVLRKNGYGEEYFGVGNLDDIYVELLEEAVKEEEPMKLVNADYGIDSVVAEKKKRRWYRHHRFPLLPLLDIQEGDEYNADHYSFSWLNLRVWSLEHFSFQFHAELDGRGLYVQFVVPYVSVVVWLLYLPERVETWIYRHLHRKPATESYL